MARHRYKLKRKRQQQELEELRLAYNKLLLEGDKEVKSLTEQVHNMRDYIVAAHEWKHNMGVLYDRAWHHALNSHSMKKHYPNSSYALDKLTATKAAIEELHALQTDFANVAESWDKSRAAFTDAERQRLKGVSYSTPIRGRNATLAVIKDMT